MTFRAYNTRRYHLDRRIKDCHRIMRENLRGPFWQRWYDRWSELIDRRAELESQFLQAGAWQR